MTKAPATPSPAVGEPAARWWAVGMLSAATLMGITVWLSVNAIAPGLELETGFSKGDVAWLTAGVQLGFVAGTLIIAATNLSDLMNARAIFAVSAVTAGALNAALVFMPGDFAYALALRILVGVSLGGVYPIGMKILAGWFRSGRGVAIGMMVAALTIGSGAPNLLNSIFAAQWETTLYISSALSVAAGGMVYFLVRDGPYEVPTAPFNLFNLKSTVYLFPTYVSRVFPSYMGYIWRNRGLRLVILGYLGHAWELYGMWVWIPAFLAVRYAGDSLFGGFLGLASLLAFLTFVAGAVGSVAAGYAAKRWGRCAITGCAMAMSGGMALSIGFLPVEWGWVIAIAALVWGASAMADSAQFSTGATELSHESFRGTTLTLEMGLGTVISFATIRLVPILSDWAGWGVAFAFLAIGPAVGIAAMLKLRSLPESAAMAMGKR